MHFISQKVNKIIADIDGRPYKLSNYTSSLGFSKVDKDYQTLFKNSDPEIREILRRAQTIDKFKANEEDITTTNSILIKNNQEPRDLQRYMHFDSSLYQTPEKIKRYLLNKLKQINTIIVLDDEENLYKKRYFQYIKDEDYSLITNIFESLPEDVDDLDLSLEGEYIKKRLRELLIEKYGENVTIDFKIQLITKYKGWGHYDLTTKKYRVEIDKYIDRFANNTNEELLEILAGLNREFNKQGLLYKNSMALVKDIDYFDRSLLISFFGLNEFLESLYKIYQPDEFGDISCEESQLSSKLKNLQESIVGTPRIR